MNVENRDPSDNQCGETKYSTELLQTHIHPLFSEVHSLSGANTTWKPRMCWLTSWSCAAASSRAWSGASPDTPVGFLAPLLGLSGAVALNISNTHKKKRKLLVSYISSLNPLFWPHVSSGEENSHYPQQPYNWMCSNNKAAVSGGVPQVTLSGRWYHPARCACQTGCAASRASPGTRTTPSQSDTHSRRGWQQRCTWDISGTGEGLLRTPSGHCVHFARLSIINKPNKHK